MDRVRADLARFYEHEATNRLRGRPSGWRVGWLDDFTETIAAEGCRSILDVGAGPATDAQPFLRAGIRYTGIDLAAAMRSICRALVPGALLMIEQWGGSLDDIDSDHTVPGHPRLFSLRTADRNRELLARHGTIEQWEVRGAGPDGWEYHAAVLRVSG